MHATGLVMFALRHYINHVLSGTDVLIERYGEPVAVLIPIEDYQQIQGELKYLRSARQVEAEVETLMDDPQALRALYTEFSVEDRRLARAGLSHYGRMLAEEEGGTHEVGRSAFTSECAFYGWVII